MADEAESVIFASTNVLVTTTLVRIDEVSYPVGAIEGVTSAEPDRRWILIAAGVAACLGLAALGGLALQGLELELLVLTGLLVAAAALRPGELVLRIADGQRKVIRSGSRAFLRRVKAAVEEAVARRR